jgi:putative solute:sodium symporter small subunit
LTNPISRAYWKSNIKILVSLLSIWFIVSFGFGILWSEELDQIKIGGFKLGFWFAQQGSIYIFVILIFIYVFLMNRLDKKYKKDISQETPE